MTRVALFTGSRSEWSLQLPIARAIAADPRLELALIVGGQHCDPSFGETVREVREAGFDIAGCVPIEPAGDTAYHATKAVGLGIEGIADVLHVLAPAWMVVYGDRFESFAACVASTQMGIATAHVEGGDYTAGGCLDDANRHAMSKLAHLHFATNEQAAERLRRMGEEPWRVHTVGLPSLDLAAAGEYASAEELRREFAIGEHQPVVLFVQHPVPNHRHASEQILPSLQTLKWAASVGYRVIALYPNADAGGRAFIAIMHAELDEVPGITVHASLGQRRFHGLLKLIGDSPAGCIVGNSSAAIKEAPWFGCPAVNVGERQAGRLRGANVADVPDDSALRIVRAVQGWGVPAWRASARDASPYGAGNAGPRICELLATTPRDARLMTKRMTY